MSINLSGDAAIALERLALNLGITQNEVIRKAIATEAYIQREIKDGGKILIQKPDKEIREVVFR